MKAVPSSCCKLVDRVSLVQAEFVCALQGWALTARCASLPVTSPEGMRHVSLTNLGGGVSVGAAGGTGYRLWQLGWMDGGWRPCAGTCTTGSQLELGRSGTEICFWWEVLEQKQQKHSLLPREWWGCPMLPAGLGASWCCLQASHSSLHTRGTVLWCWTGMRQASWDSSAAPDAPRRELGEISNEPLQWNNRKETLAWRPVRKTEVIVWIQHW